MFALSFYNYTDFLGVLNKQLTAIREMKKAYSTAIIRSLAANLQKVS